jgi:hypothetical protein
MAKSQKSKGLVKNNPNHLILVTDQLQFEVLGGVNPEQYHSIRIMLITSFGRVTHRNNVDLYNHEQLTAYTREVANKTGIHISKVNEAFEELIISLEEYKKELQENNGRPIEEKQEYISNVDRAISTELLTQPQLLKKLNNLIQEAGVVGNETQRQILFLTHLTRKLNTSLHSVIQSDYNYLQSKMVELIPEEEKYCISNISDNFLFYFKENELQNKVLFIEDTISNRKQLIPLIGFQNNNLVTKTTVKKNEYQELETYQKVIRGNVSLSITTKSEEVFTTNNKLSIVIHEETGSEQDEKMLLYQRKQSAGIVNSFTENKAIEQIQNLQRVLEPITIINPFAMSLELPIEVQNKQITNLHYLRFIEVITFLHQYQRTKKVNTDTGEEYIETSIEDIEIANELLKEILINTCDTLNTPTRLHFERLKEYLLKSKKESFTNTEVSIALNVPISSIKRYHATLLSTGKIRATGQGNRATGYEYEVITKTDLKELVESVEKTFKNTLKLIQGSSKAHGSSNQNELPKPRKSVACSKVAQKVEGVIEKPKKEVNNSFKKQVA